MDGENGGNGGRMDGRGYGEIKGRKKGGKWNTWISPMIMKNDVEQKNIHQKRQWEKKNFVGSFKKVNKQTNKQNKLTNKTNITLSGCVRDRT
jgi:hypothetical protein